MIIEPHVSNRILVTVGNRGLPVDDPLHLDISDSPDSIECPHGSFTIRAYVGRLRVEVFSLKTMEWEPVLLETDAIRIVQAQ